MFISFKGTNETILSDIFISARYSVHMLMIMHWIYMHHNTHKATLLCVIDRFVVFHQSLESFLSFIKIQNQMID